MGWVASIPFEEMKRNALMLAQTLKLDDRFKPSVAAYWQRLQQREAFGRALKSQQQAAQDQGLSTRPAA